MSCDCRKKLEEKLAANFPEAAIDYELLSGKTFSFFRFKQRHRNQLIERKTFIFHSYCPWCGKPYDEPEPVGNQGYAKISPGLQVLEGDKHE